MEGNNPPQPGALPQGISLVLLLVMIFFFFLLGQGVTYLAGLAMGMDPASLMSNPDLLPDAGQRNRLRVVVLISHVFTFILPALAWGYTLYKRNLWERFYLNRAPRPAMVGLGMLWILIAFPLAQVIYWFNKEILPIPAWASSMEESIGAMVKSFLTMESPIELVFSLVVMALLPAIGEEMIFRGGIQRTLLDRIRNPHVAIWLSACIFSFFHMQFEGFLPRVLLGGLLGYLFWWRRNLWVAIAAHFANNGVQVVAAYFMQDQLDALESFDPQKFPWMVAVLSLIFTAGIAGYLHKRREVV